MSVWAVEAAAGYGKTHRLMQVLQQALTEQPLGQEQRVLALTFMHGARRRLDERLRSVPELAGRYTCLTIDSFAWRVRQRWQSLASFLGLPPTGAETSFEEECGFAARLLSQAVVQQWVATSFPVVLVDEAQDLTPPRLEMISALSSVVRLHLAADEFQCLVPALRPNPLKLWLPQVCVPETLPMPRRTNVRALIDAATAIRSGRAPAQGGGFKIVPGPKVPLASALLASAIKWSKGGSVAVLAPSLQGNYVRDVISQVQSAPSGREKNLGPFPIRWEESERDEMAKLDGRLELPEKMTVGQALEILGGLPRSGHLEQTMNWLKRMRNTTGRADTTSTEVVERIKRYISLRRQHVVKSDSGLMAMTVHQAKNREFDGVVVLWPYTVKADDEGKRRLLYNAVTRARRWCTVIVQSPSMLRTAPFAQAESASG